MHIIFFLETHPIFFLSFIFVLGLTVGSFLNVVIYRYPIMLKSRWKQECHEFLAEEQNPDTIPDDSNSSKKPFNLSHPPSTCPHCGHQITAIENIPVLSWLILQAKCSNCKEGISARYPMVELFTAVISITIAWYFGVTLTTLAFLGLCWTLIALSFIDFDTQLLPDDMTNPLLWAGLLSSLVGISHVSLADAVVGAIVGYLSLWSVFHIFRILTGKEGMGYGDFKLFAALGAWMGWQMLPLVLFLSAMVGAAIGLGLIIIKGRDKNIPIPFGPYLAAAGFFALIWGQQITELYLASLAPTQ